MSKQEITQHMINGFSNYLIRAEKSERTIDKYSRDVKRFCDWTDGRPIDKNCIIEYKRHFALNHAPASVNSMIASLNSFLMHIGMPELRVKTLKLQKQIFASDERQLTREEYKRLLKTAERGGNIRLNLIMQTICSAGIRVSELKYITVEALKNGRAEINLKGKIRVILLNKNLCKLLEKYIRQKNITSGAVFITRSGRPVDRSNIWAQMKLLCADARVDARKVFPHNLRHLFARMFYGIEKDIVKLANLLGHSSIETTRIYVMESAQKCAGIINSLGLVT